MKNGINFARKSTSEHKLVMINYPLFSSSLGNTQHIS